MTACVLPYHGGKSRIASKVASVLDGSRCEHYCEPFAGGLAVLFATRQRRVETINDKTDAVIAFWDAIANTPDAFHALATSRAIYSETLYIRSCDLLRGHTAPQTRVELAWALWYCSCTSFGHKAAAGFGYTIAAGASVSNLDSRITRLFNQSARIKRFQIFNRCGLKLIAAMNSPDVLLYCDPPYVGTTVCDAYSDFNADDLITLCDLLRTHDGDWAISGYDHPTLLALAREYRAVEITTIGTLAHSRDTMDTRQQVAELLITNIEPTAQQLALQTGE